MRRALRAGFRGGKSHPNVAWLGLALTLAKADAGQLQSGLDMSEIKVHVKQRF